MEHTDVIGLEVVGLKVQKDEGEASVRLNRELLVELVEDSLNGKHDVDGFAVEKVV